MRSFIRLAAGVENSARILKGVNAIRYLYRPYHPWRHGYRREKIRKAACCKDSEDPFTAGTPLARVFLCVLQDDREDIPGAGY